jgi:hypothetical protein
VFPSACLFGTHLPARSVCEERSSTLIYCIRHSARLSLPMPFTLAHPAAIIPIHKALGSRTSLSALVIGSMMPDLAYFVRLGVSAQTSHSLHGIFLFCVPVGLIVFALFHLLLKRPAAALLPARMLSRLSPKSLDPPQVSGTLLLSVILSLGLGAFTHIAWDAFTHADTLMVDRFDFLRMVIGPIGGYKLYVYKVLQHLSSLIGLLALALWIFRWANTVTASDQVVQVEHLPLIPRVTVIVGILVAGLACAVMNSAARRTAGIEHMVMDAVVGGLVGTALSASLFCLGWHVFQLYRKRSV